jgi:predicted alpha/beta-hydrolase family hydrolase
MKPGPFRVALGDGEVTAIGYPATREPCASFLFAHGAGAGQRHPYMVGTAERLALRGVSVVTFDFPYTEQGRKVPDLGPVLERCLRAVFDAVRASTEGPLYAGGKSMGGRIASQVAAKGAIDPAGLVFLGYPLHPPGKPAQRRDKHLPSVRAPMLFVQGTRDVFATPDEIAPLLPTLAKGSVLFPVEGGDHSHAVLKRSGVPQDAVYAAIADRIAAFMGASG